MKERERFFAMSMGEICSISHILIFQLLSDAVPCCLLCIELLNTLSQSQNTPQTQLRARLSDVQQAA